jgi:hypothetical protein
MRTVRPIKISIVSLAIILFAICVVSGRRVGAFSHGPPTSYTNAPGESNCTACHTSYELNSGPGHVMISGLPAAYSPNQEVVMSVTTFHPDGFLYGFQLTAIDGTGTQAGTLVATDAVNTQLVSGFVLGNPRQYIEHTFAGAFPVEFNQRTWTFKWTAPAASTGPVTFYVAGNGGNGDGESTGDYIYTSSVTVSPGEFDVCVQDESNGRFLEVNLTTGEYELVNCQGITVGGTGTLIKRGCYITLQDNRADRRLLARLDTCAKTGTVSLQLFSPARTFTITDRNTTNNSCACQ